MEQVRQVRNELERRGHNPLLFFLKCLDADDARPPARTQPRRNQSLRVVHPLRPPERIFARRFFRVADDLVIHDERRDHETKERQQDQCVIGQQAH